MAKSRLSQPSESLACPAVNCQRRKTAFSFQPLAISFSLLKATLSAVPRIKLIAES
jgi:hypothetical protein